MFDRLRRDIQRYFALDSDSKNPGLRDKIRVLADATALQGIAVYRFGSWVQREVKSRAIRYPLKLAYFAADKVSTMMWGLHIDPGADIGGGLYIAHPGGILIGPVKMGSDCNIGSNVVLGRRTDGKGNGAAPTLGDRVWIGTGSVVFGGISIGSGTSIGPLTVVARNLPPRCMVSGNPMQMMSSSYDNVAQIYGKNGPLEPASEPQVDTVPATVRAPAPISAVTAVRAEDRAAA